ncbi:hypothetical protein LXT21_13110 [Myxococcus sp. K38C18041901]|uniref:hypothetical protein n=1 Tax=Myxococcus guangdongensis TaxID=2906760 RepID=UPI0020A7DB76|nr:hypothetical protein [Myxococcus guangdongensis]MCP3059719.1 hypothetical protein [Myxococcus guangdongensis]
MSERVRAASAVLSEPPASEEDLRLRLEGKVEFIEVALYRYAPLVDALASRHWLRNLRATPDLLRKVRELEGLLPEVLVHLEQRGNQDGWPRGSRIPSRLRRLRKVRERVFKLLHRKVGMLLLLDEHTPQREALARLESYCLEESPVAPTPDGSFAMHVGSAPEVMRYVYPVLAFMVGSLATVGLMAHQFSMLAAMLFGLLMFFLWPVPAVLMAMWMTRTPGAAWLTPERLVWLAPRGEPSASVRLDSLGDASVQLEHARRGTLRLRGNRGVRLPRLGREKAARLRVWLELFRAPQVRANAARAERPVELVTWPARLRRHGAWTSGQLLMSPRGVSFLPAPEPGAALMKAATGRTLDGRVELAWVLEGLRWQPESELEALLARAVEASGGAAWPSEEVRVAPGVEGAREVHLVRGEEALVGMPGKEERNTVLERLHAWASRVTTR